MKRLLFLLLILLSAETLIGAEFEVRKYFRDDKDLTVRLTPLQDLNDEYCGMLKVKTDISGVRVVSNAVVKQEENTGELRVWLSPGAKRIEFVKEGYIPLTHILDERIAEKVVHVIELTTKAGTGAEIPVHIRTKPENASIEVNGKALSSQPVILREGKHKLKITASGYKTISEEIEVNPKNSLFEYTMEIQMDVPVSISSTPSGVTVYIDDIKIGTTPKDFFYPSGTYTIKLAGSDYADIEESIVIKEPQTVKNYTMQDVRAELTVKTGSSSTVYINGTSYKGGVDNLKISPNQMVNIKVTTPKAENISRSIVLKEKDKKVLELYPIISKGTVAVNVLPVGAEVSLRGDGGESYTAAGSKVFTDIPVGEYALEIKAKKHKTHKESFTLSKDKLVKKQITLEEGSNLPDNMILIEHGTNKSGTINYDFYIGKYEVTQKEWKEIMGANPSYFKGDNLPVVNISWYNVQEYIRKLNDITDENYRLPTEAEWEYVASGGNQSKNYRFAGSDSVEEVAWFWKNSGYKKLTGKWDYEKLKQNNCRIHPIGTKKPNELGVHDMSGNVWEWCWDWYDSNKDFKIIRGGSWDHNSNFYGNCEVFSRSKYNPNNHSDSIGFRLVCFE